MLWDQRFFFSFNPFAFLFEIISLVSWACVNVIPKVPFHFKAISQFTVSLTQPCITQISSVKFVCQLSLFASLIEINLFTAWNPRMNRLARWMISRINASSQWVWLDKLAESNSMERRYNQTLYYSHTNVKLNFLTWDDNFARFEPGQVCWEKVAPVRAWPSGHREAWVQGWENLRKFNSVCFTTRFGWNQFDALCNSNFRRWKKLELRVKKRWYLSSWD